MRIEKIEKFEKIINDNKYSMFQLMILYNMNCHENYAKLNDEQKEKLLGVIYNRYLKDETFTDLAHFSDIVMNNYDIIYKMLLNGEHEKIRKIIDLEV